ncbi:MAG: ROK family protein, partial [Bacteroidota bacterium]
MAATHAIGVDLGGTTIKVGLVEKAQGIVSRATSETNAMKGPDAVVGRIIDAVGQVLEKLPEDGTLAGVGLGSPGSITWDRTTVVKPPNFHGWNRVNLVEALRDGIPSL